MPPRTRILLLLLLALLLLVASRLVQRVRSPPPLSSAAARHEMAQCAAALGPVRAVQGRLAGTFAYAPYLTPANLTVAGPQLRAVARGVRLESARPESARLHELAQLQLLAGKPRNAARLLRRAVQLSASDASAWSDLAAALLEIHREDGLPTSALAALDAADEAASPDPRFAVARFNRALALERLHMVDAALLEWSDYLKIDERSPWAREARAHVAVLTSGLAQVATRFFAGHPQLANFAARGDARSIRHFLAHHPGVVREVVDEHLLAAWQLRPRAQQPPRRLAPLDALAVVACQVRVALGDAVHDEALAIARRDDFADLLARMRLRFRQHEALRRHPPAGLARPLLRTGRAGSRFGAARDRALERALRLPARLALLLAASPGMIRDPDELPDPVADQEQAAMLGCFLGSRDEHLGGARELYAFLENEAGAHLRHNDRVLALRAKTRLTQLVDAAGPAAARAWAHLRAARLVLAIGRTHQARFELRQAERVLDVTGALQSPAVRSEIRLLRRQLSDLPPTTRAPAERRDLDRAIALHRAEDPFGHLPELLCQRAWRSEIAGDSDAAQRDMRAAIADALRPPLSTAADDPAAGDSRLADRVAPLVDLLLTWQIRRRLDEHAFHTVESFRAHALLARWRHGTEVPPSSSELAVRLPMGTTAVELATVGDRLVIWLRDCQRRMTIVQPRTVADMLRQIAALREALSAGDRGRLSACLTRLYQLLVAPWRTAVSPGENLVFVPTGALYAVPFAALLDPSSHRFLIQDHALAIATSVTAYVAALERERRLAHIQAPMQLVVAAPGALPLQRLAAAEREAARIAALYQHSTLLLGETANVQRLLRLLPRSDIAHFTAHAADEDDPQRSRLLLAGVSVASGLTAAQVSRLSFDRTRLVVLAACSTAAGRISPSEGPLSIAHAFAIAGVPAVVSTLWSVDDRASERLFVHFHTLLGQGLAPRDALRGAQLAEIDAHPDDWTWAAVELFGA